MARTLGITKETVLQYPASVRAIEVGERADETGESRAHAEAARLHYRAAQAHEHLQREAEHSGHRRDARAHEWAKEAHLRAYEHHTGQVDVEAIVDRISQWAFEATEKANRARTNPHAHWAALDLHHEALLHEDGGLEGDLWRARREGAFALAAQYEQLIKAHKRAIRMHEDALWNLGYDQDDAFDWFDPDQLPASMR